VPAGNGVRPSRIGLGLGKATPVSETRGHVCVFWPQGVLFSDELSGTRFCIVGSLVVFLRSLSNSEAFKPYKESANRLLQ
jgi:hypothetical protein